MNKMSFRTRAKICGITRVEDASAAVNAGADALGFVFYQASSRYIQAHQAAKITQQLAPFVSKVALFVNPSREEVDVVLNAFSVDVIQFHGDEDEAFCQSFNTPYIKAIRMQQQTDISQCAKTYHSAAALLLDAFDQAQFGGTGETFDWALLPENCSLPLILAGGLGPNNVCQAIQHTQPYAVDVSSGVEKSKGVKDHRLIKQFMQEVKRAHQ